MKRKLFLTTKTVKFLFLFFLLCSSFSNVSAQYYTGSRFHYDILAKKRFGAECQALYNALVIKAEALHQDFTTTYSTNVFCVIRPEDYGFRRTNGNGMYFDLDALEAIDFAFVAFFQDNVQYFMLSPNLGFDNNYNYEVYFEKPDMNITPSNLFYDYRLPSDRKAHIDMVNAAFAIYKKLTKNATSKYEIARIIHDKIVSDWDYAARSNTVPGIHDLIGPMGYSTNGIVCEAYAKMFSFMSNNLGVTGVFIPGEMLSTNGFPAGGHAWNIALMDDGNFYYLDATWADIQRADFDIGNYRNPISYEWFLLGADNGKFDALHYAGVGSMLTVYEKPANLGGPDYDYKNIYPYKFLTDIKVDRSQEFNLGTYYMPSNGVLDIKPKYYDNSLICGVDYDVEIEQPLKLGKNRVWFHGKGNFRGIDFGVINVVSQNQTLNITVSIPTDIYEYTGQAIEPTPVVKNGSVTLIDGQDYIVSYKNNINRGTAKIIVSGLGMYAGTYEKEFFIIVKSNGTNISAADFDKLWSNAKNYMVVIKKTGGIPNVEKSSITNIQNAADFFGVNVYYIDWDPSISNYTFYNAIMNEFPKMGVTAINHWPVLAVVGTPTYFGVDAAEKQMGNSGTSYGLHYEEYIRDMIRKYIDLGSITGPAPVNNQQSLQAFISNGKLQVFGMTVGMPLDVYGINGSIYHKGFASSDHEEIPLPARGIYIVKSKRSTIMLSW
jgi:hypothetical protein